MHRSTQIVLQNGTFHAYSEVYSSVGVEWGSSKDQEKLKAWDGSSDGKQIDGSWSGCSIGCTVVDTEYRSEDMEMIWKGKNNSIRTMMIWEMMIREMRSWKDRGKALLTFRQRLRLQRISARYSLSIASRVAFIYSCWGTRSLPWRWTRRWYEKSEQEMAGQMRQVVELPTIPLCLLRRRTPRVCLQSRSTS